MLAQCNCLLIILERCDCLGETNHQKLKRELLAGITVVNFNCNSMADDFLLGKKVALNSIINCVQEKKGDL